MKKRLKKKRIYKTYMQDIFKGYEKMLLDESISELSFHYLKEKTILSRDSQGAIHFVTKDA